MKNIDKKVFSTALLTSIISTLVLGASVSYAKGMPFAEMDVDRNGVVSEQEFNTVKNQRIEARAREGRQMRGLGNAPVFAEFDVNKDGQITPEEVAMAQQTRMQARSEQLMGQGRGQGMRGMGMRGNRPEFSDFDANADSYVTRQEFYDARNKRIEERVKQGFAMRGLATAPTFTDVDSNGDGKVSQSEFMVQQQRHMQNGSVHK